MKIIPMNQVLHASVLIASLIFVMQPLHSQEASGSLIEEIIVTSQRTEESLQDVPIAVTALTSSMLEDMQVEGGSDIQLVAPSVSFQGSDATGGSFNIRGITNLAVSPTAESGVEIHVNDMPVGATTMQDGDFLDMERIEVLRGPQGTLYGKNSVGGVINLITAKPQFGEFIGKFSVDTGSYDLLKTKVTLNIPLSETLAMRIATNSIGRDGDIKNIYSKAKTSHVNDRNSDAYRISLAWDMSDKTDVLFMRENYSENSNRHYVNNVYCQRDTSFTTGCVPGGTRVHELTHPMATFVENLAVLTGILDFTTSTDMSGAPKGFWEANIRGNPKYVIDQDITQLIVNHELNDNWNLTFSALKKDRLYDRTGSYSSEEMDRLRFKDNPYFPGGNIPMSGYGSNCNIADGTMGIYGGCITDTMNYPDGFDRQFAKTESEVFELRIQSNLDGQWNYLFGAIHSEGSGLSVYDIAANGLDALALAPPPVLTNGVPQGYVQLYAPLYQTNTKSATRSSAIFGEVYYQANDRLKYTVGLRNTEDYKEQYGFSPFLKAPGFGSIGGGFTALPGTSLPTYGDSWYNGGAVGDPETEYSNTTGRFVVDYALNDHTLVYGSISKGFKGGGFNPPLDPAKYPGTPQVFPDTELMAYEVGMKIDFPERGMRLNTSAYMYDASDYQVTKIQNKSRVNEGIDVDMMGIESEFIWVPLTAPQWQINAGISFEESEIASGNMLLNPTNPDLCLTTGCGNWHRMKDGSDGEVFVVRKDIASAIYQTWLAGAWGPLQNGVLLPAEFHGDIAPGVQTPVSYLQTGVTPGHLPSLTASRTYYEYMAGAMCAAFGCAVGDVVKDGLLSDISGNQLTHPDYMANVGVQYTMTTKSYRVNFRLDAYHQAERYTSLFNLSWDKIDPWTEYNALISITPAQEDAKWRVDIYGQNITDEENVTNIGDATAPLGFSKSIWARPQATYGIKWTLNF